MACSVLFVCTGNYYRSRFAELLFNALAERAGLDWHAESRGFRLGQENVGPIARQVIRGLQARGIEPPAQPRYPLQLQDRDLNVADRIVALKEDEHRPYVQLLFPGWNERVEYWHVHDLDLAAADAAFAEIERNVRELIARLA